MSGELIIKSDPTPRVHLLDEFNGECFSYKGDNYIVLSQDELDTGIDPVKKTVAGVLCLNLNGPFVVCLPNEIEIIPIDIEISVKF